MFDFLRQPVRRICLPSLLLTIAAPAQDFIPPPVRNKNATVVLSTAYHPVQVRYYDDLLPAADIQAGGAIDMIGDNYLGVTGAGAFFRITWNQADDAITAEKLPIPAPHNPAVFDKAADPVINREFFRVIDIVAQPAGTGWELYASHHHWLPEQNCLVMRISAVQLDAELRQVEDTPDPWLTIYDTTPCLTLDAGNRGRIFAGHESGGRMAWLRPGKLLFSTGDQEHDGWNQPVAMAQSNQHMYGKIILIDVESDTARIYSKGHRNPQGLYIDKAGNIWESEHGPRGGDEINLLAEGKNYGWPAATYGTDYGRFHWPPAKHVGEHGGYEQPVYAFIPSIGTSNLMRIEGTQFSHWQGNLLVAGLASQSLHRLGLDGTRVVYSEPLPINRRIRDLIVGPKEQIWLWGERGDLIVLSIADSHDRGAVLFQSCANCHTTGVTSGNLAPSLFRIVGRRMAARTDFTYSDAFRKLEGEWTEERLDNFLQNPNAFVPGTAMSTITITDPEERKAIIDYLKDLW
jgi:cytochrome c2